jgi:hypothetical protein
VQSTLRRFIRLSQRGVQVFVHDVRFRKNYLPGQGAPTFIQRSFEGIVEQRSEGNWAEIGEAMYEDLSTPSPSIKNERG